MHAALFDEHAAHTPHEESDRPSEIEEILEALTDQGKDHFLEELEAAVSIWREEGSSEPLRRTVIAWHRAMVIMTNARSRALLFSSGDVDVEGLGEGQDLDQLLQA